MQHGSTLSTKPVGREEIHFGRLFFSGATGGADGITCNAEDKETTLFCHLISAIPYW